MENYSGCYIPIIQKQPTRKQTMKKIKKSINVKCFIVPNKPSTFDGTRNYVLGSEKGDWWAMKNFADRGDDCFKWGIDPMDLGVTIHSQWVQVWFYDDDNDNLTDHGCKAFAALGLRSRMPSFLPEEFLKGVNEGDSKTVYIKYNRFGESFEEDSIIELNITFVQAGKRYSRFGKFDEVLKALL